MQYASLLRPTAQGLCLTALYGWPILSAPTILKLVVSRMKAIAMISEASVFINDEPNVRAHWRGLSASGAARGAERLGSLASRARRGSASLANPATAAKSVRTVP